MTSLSHDVRTPLTTLLGYLDATHKGLVTGKDRDDYIETARRKAHDLKEYIDVLFDWFKLNSNEFALEIQSVEVAELTRNILIDWIPIFEDKQAVSYTHLEANSSDIIDEWLNRFGEIRYFFIVKDSEIKR